MRRLWLAFGAVLIVSAFSNALGVGHGTLYLAYAALYVAVLAEYPMALRIVAALLYAFSILVCAYAVLQWHYYPGRPWSLFRSANFLGAFAVLMIFLPARCTPAIGRIVIATNILSLALSESRGALAAFILGLAVYDWRRYRWLTLALGVAFLGMMMHRGIADPRLAIWKIAVQIGLAQPIFGWGHDAVGIGLNGMTTFYSVPISWFVWTGFVGLAAVLWCYAEMLSAARTNRAALAFLTAYAVQGLFLFPDWPTTVPLLTVLAYLMSERRNVAQRAAVVDDGQPLLNRGVRAHRAD